MSWSCVDAEIVFVAPNKSVSLNKSSYKKINRGGRGVPADITEVPPYSIQIDAD